MYNGDEVAYIPRMLNTAEGNYSQLDLALVFGVKNFTHIFFGHKFTLNTDTAKFV